VHRACKTPYPDTGIAHHLVGATVPGGRVAPENIAAVPVGTAALEDIVAVLVVTVVAPVGTVAVLVTTAVALVDSTNNERKKLFYEQFGISGKYLGCDGRDAVLRKRDVPAGHLPFYDVEKR
jgi:hypothetical protein